MNMNNEMLEWWNAISSKEGIGNIDFIQADATDLSEFRDKKFDLVLNQDGAISFSGKDYAKVIKETYRGHKKKALRSAGIIALAERKE